MRQWIVIGAVTGAILGVVGPAAAQMPLDQIVPDYMEGDLETAIIPTPRHAELSDSAVALEAPPIIVVSPAWLAQIEAAREAGLADQERAYFDALRGGADAKAARQAETPMRQTWKKFHGDAETPRSPAVTGAVLELLRLAPEATFADAPPSDADRPVWWLAADDAAAHLPADAPATPRTDRADTAAEAYALASTMTRDGRSRVIIRGASAWGVLWGVQSLRQMVFKHDGQSYVRLGQLADHPTMWFRGGKRAQDWWVRYKGNSAFDGYAYRYDLHRTPRDHNWRVEADAKRLEKYKRSLDKVQKLGGDYFLLDYNDGRFTVPEQDNEPFPGQPGQTVRFLFDTLRAERDRIGADFDFGYMGAAYWLNNGNFLDEAQALKEAGALEGVDLIFTNGLEVFTEVYHHDAARAYRDALGFEGSMVIYDCQCLHRPLSAIDYHDDRVWRQIQGVSAQDASPVFFITLADYTWNPQAYDPQRSLKLALREMAGRDPAFYKALQAFIDYYHAHDFIIEYLPRQEVLEREAAATAGMVERLAKVEPFLESADFARLVGFNPSVVVDPRVAHAELMKEHGFKEYRVQRAADITIDGKLDEPAWRSAPTMDSFITPNFLVRGKMEEIQFLPEEGRSVRARALYDDQAFYMALEVKGASPQVMQYFTLSEEEIAKLPGKPPMFEIFLNAELDYRAYWQVLHQVNGESISTVFGYFDPRRPYYGGEWDAKPTFQYRQTGEDSYVFEGRIDYWDAIQAPQPGDVWAVQLQLNRILALTEKGSHDWLYWWSHTYKGLRPFRRHYGRWIFE